MNILVFSHYFPPEVNAPASRTFEHCRVWARQGHQVTVVTGVPNHPRGQVYPGYSNRHWSQQEIRDGVRVVRVWTYLAANEGTIRRSANYLSYAASAAWRACRGQRPDVVLATTPQFFCAWAGLAAARAWKCPFVLEVRDLWPESIEAVGASGNKTLLRSLEYLERTLYRSADHIVTVGGGYRDRILAKCPDVAPRCSVITNGVDMTAWPLTKADPFLRTEWNGPDPESRDRFVCAYVGTLGMAHGLEVTVHAAKLLRDRGRRDIVFWLVGDGAERAKLQQLAINHGVADQVLFPGQVTKQQVRTVLATADATLIHLRGSELFQSVLPSKLFEAMAMNRPTILGVPGEATKLAAQVHQQTDWPLQTIAPDDQQALADALLALAECPSTASDQSVRRLVGQHFSRDALAGMLLRLLEDVVNKGQAAPVNSLATLDTQPATEQLASI